MNAFPQLETPRLRLRELTEADIPRIVVLAGDPAVAATTLTIPHPYEEKDAQYWLDTARRGFASGDAYIFGIERKADGEFIGGISLTVAQRHDRAEIGYWIGPPYWNQGFCTEAVRVLLHFGFEVLGLNKILSTHYTDNPASGKVMIKNGMVHEADMLQHFRKGGRYRDLRQYRLTRAEYAQLPPQR